MKWNLAVEKAYETRLASVRKTRDTIWEVHRGGVPQRDIPAADDTWWGALNTPTGWVDHVQDTDSDRYAHILFGAGFSAESGRARTNPGDDWRGELLRAM